MPLSEYKRFMEALNYYNESYDLAFEDAMADKLKDLLGDDYYKNVYIPFKDKIASKVKVGEDEDGQPIMGENPDLKLKQPKYLLDTYSNNPQELKDLIDNYKTKRATITQKKIDGAKKIGENDEYICYRITKYPAAQYYGSNTTWCITGRYEGEEERGEYYFNKYINEEDLDGGYYFFLHKTNPRRKYALLQKKDKTIDSIWSALNSPIWSALNPQLTKDRVPVFPLVKEIPELEDIYEDVDIENPEHIKDRDRKSLEHDILISCKLENAKDAIRNLKEILDGDAYKDYKFDLDNIKDEKGNTPLYWACINNYTEVAKLLIEHGADIDIKDNRGNTPLYQACFKNNTEIAKLLIEYGADVNIKNKDGYTPLSMACSNDNTELVKLLIEHGADKSVNIKDKYGYTSLYLACSHNYTEVAKLLIEYGADVNIKDTYGYTPLSMACAKNNTELVKLLLEHGADVNSKDKSGYTPLIYACYDNNIELAKLLIEHGAGKDLDANNLPRYITKDKQIEDLVLSFLNSNKKTESIKIRRLYRL